MSQAALKRVQKYSGTRTAYQLNTRDVLFPVSITHQNHRSSCVNQKETCFFYIFHWMRNLLSARRGWYHTGRGKGKHQKQEKTAEFGEQEASASSVANRSKLLLLPNNLYCDWAKGRGLLRHLGSLQTRLQRQVSPAVTFHRGASSSHNKQNLVHYSPGYQWGSWIFILSSNAPLPSN